jgi:hypothetical protein
MSPAALVDAESCVIWEGYQTRLSMILNLGHQHLAKVVTGDFLDWA